LLREDGEDRCAIGAAKTRTSSGTTLSCCGDPTQADYLGTTAALLIGVGVGVGVGVGLLLAPASGEQTRGTLTNKVQEFGDRVRDKFGPSH
jgi:hypothetical protein